jgi:hypothetical protein
MYLRSNHFLDYTYVIAEKQFSMIPTIVQRGLHLEKI